MLAAGGIYPGASDFIVSEGRMGNEYLSSTYMLDLVQERWFLLETQQMTYSPSVPHGRAYHASTMISPSRMVIFGGCVRHGPCPAADFWLFRADSHVWEKLSSCSAAREDASMILYNSSSTELYIVLMGGKTNGAQTLGGSSMDTNDIYIFDLSNREWMIKNVQDEAPSVRSGASMVSSDSVLYLFGGANSDGVLLNDLWGLSGNPKETVDSLRECESSFFSLISLHGLFMFLSFGFLLQLSGMLANYSTTVDTPSRFHWKYIHGVLQIISSVLGFVGFICGLSVVPRSGHFRSVHGGLGIFLICLTVVQGMLILLTRYLVERKSGILKCHFWVGLGIMTLSIVNISLGLFLGMSESSVWISWFVYVLILMLAFIVMQTVAVFSEDEDEEPPHPRDHSQITSSLYY